MPTIQHGPVTLAHAALVFGPEGVKELLDHVAALALERAHSLERDATLDELGALSAASVGAALRQLGDQAAQLHPDTPGLKALLAVHCDHTGDGSGTDPHRLTAKQQGDAFARAVQALGLPTRPVSRPGCSVCSWNRTEATQDAAALAVASPLLDVFQHALAMDFTEAPTESPAVQLVATIPRASTGTPELWRVRFQPRTWMHGSPGLVAMFDVRPGRFDTAQQVTDQQDPPRRTTPPGGKVAELATIRAAAVEALDGTELRLVDVWAHANGGYSVAVHPPLAVTVQGHA